MKLALFRFLLLFTFLLTPVVSLFAEMKTIYLKNGQVIRAEILQQTAASMTIKTADGKTIQLNKSEINTVSFNEPTKVQQEEKKPVQAEQTPTPQIIEVPKPLVNFHIDQLKRNDLEISFGLGAGRYSPETQELPVQVQNKMGLVSGTLPTVIDKPTHSPELSQTYGAIYTWKRWSGGITGSYLGNRSTYDSHSYASGMMHSTGSFPERQSSLKNELSFLAFTNDRFDLRPTIGYQHFWGQSQDTNLSTSYYIDTGLYLYSQGVMKFNETLKGYSIGLKATIRMGERWENRLEYHNLTLSGNQDGSIVSGLVPTNLSQVAFYRQDQNISWNANGFHLLYRLVYRVTPTISVYAGFQFYEWKYNLNSYQQYLYSSKDGLIGVDLSNPGAYLIQQKVMEAVGKTINSESRSAILEFGVMKRFEFISKI
ncbi:LA_0442/LA_0875 N-terminal domain-containing protein [Leptospira koniambonensis]|uniref:LA_0442/LA_0875 N-terminal domain-containing protein n=1 Tax=Leptospira koniambonensis TaxID=2484950 RepID=UPI003EB6BACB